MSALLLTVFLLSGAAALLYQVAWVRSLSLVFGGSHLAVTTVLAVFMGGLALGGYVFGRAADRSRRPLRLYGMLEIGIGLFGAAFVGLMAIYPTIYVPLARLGEENRLYLTVLRVLLATGAIIVPTTLMGGTLPVLVRFASERAGVLPRRLSLLYGMNTLGAVAGTLAAGFVLLRTFGLTRTLLVAAGINLVIGAACMLLPERIFGSGRSGPEASAPATEVRAPERPADAPPAIAYRLVLWGIGVSGFCALGYEVLWTRMLSLVVGTSVYSFAVMLVAFLAGIATGSAVLGAVSTRVGQWTDRRTIAAFGLAELGIGIAALGVTVLLRDLPTHAMRFQSLLLGQLGSEFGVRQGANFLIAFGYMFIPALFMGVAFPLAGQIATRQHLRVGEAVGSVLAWNTLGAILGAAASGFALIYLLGIERSLQVLVLLNVTFGVVIVLCAAGRVRVALAAAAVASIVLVARAGWADWGRVWDARYFAIFRNNQRSAFDTEERRRDALANTEVLYVHEGVNETISVIRPRGSMQGLVVNGRVEASSSKMDMQCQRTLGHLPMLLHPDPRAVFVLGLGTGMTLGATSLHPEVEEIVLAEIEPGVLEAARAFGPYNNYVLEQPKLRIVFNDGRNFLATTKKKFDVITADPIHPWSGGAAYLYTDEYFRTVVERLRPGGVACQWLPIYELTPDDIRTVVKTFARNFKYAMVWLTHYDAELVGSNAPIRIDEAQLARRLANREIQADLEAVEMGSAEDFLSYFVLGPSGVAAFAAEGGIINTDDNLHLEFVAPESMGVARLMGDNVVALARRRESILPYLDPAETPEGIKAQQALANELLAAGRVYDSAHAMHLWNRIRTPEFAQLETMLAERQPEYAPARFLRGELADIAARTPRPVGSVLFAVREPGGRAGTIELHAVTMRIGVSRGAIVLADNAARSIYGQRYVDRTGERLLDDDLERSARAGLAALEAAMAGLPSAGSALPARADAEAALRDAAQRWAGAPEIR